MVKEKIIHQVWVGPKPAPESWMNSWRDKHPSWRYMLWDNSTIRDFPFVNSDKIAESFRRQQYDALGDLIGYEALLNYGGFLAQADSICLNPIDELMEIDEDCFACYENETKRPGLLAIFIGASQGCPLINEVIGRLHLRTRPLGPTWMSTGPKLFTATVQELNYPIKIYPSHYFLPEHYSGKGYIGEDKIYARHFWGTTKDLYR